MLLRVELLACAFAFAFTHCIHTLHFVLPTGIRAPSALEHCWMMSCYHNSLTRLTHVQIEIEPKCNAMQCNEMKCRFALHCIVVAQSGSFSGFPLSTFLFMHIYFFLLLSFFLSNPIQSTGFSCRMACHGSRCFSSASSVWFLWRLLPASGATISSGERCGERV